MAGVRWSMAAESQEVVITGLGAIAPSGVGVEAFARSLRAGVSGVRPVSWSHPRCAATVAAECVGFEPRSVMSEADLARVPRLVPMGLCAAREACAMAGLPEFGGVERVGLVEEARRVGLVLGTGGGGIDFTLDQTAGLHADRKISLWTITNATHGNLAGELSIRLGLRGPSLCVSTGCASSSDALGMARDVLLSDRPGAPTSMVVVGADAHVRWETISAMELLGVLSTRRWESAAEAATASRPFDASRDGFVLGEGAWAVVLERASTARARGASVIATLAGYGATCDAFHRVRPAPDMEESARAMRMAMEDAGVVPEEIDLIHYHGTATALNDALETKAVKLALGEARARRVPGQSVKSMIGHPQGACGMAAVVSTLACLRGTEPVIFPTINLERPDAACDLDYTANVARAAGGVQHVLVNCLAFGAKNSALVLRVGEQG